MSDSLRVENPLGFRVTDYRVDNDYSSLPAAPATGAVINAQPQVAAQQPGTGVVDPNAASVSGAIPQGGVPLQQGALPQGGVPQQQAQPAFPDQMQPPGQPAIQPQGTPNNVNGASGR